MRALAARFPGALRELDDLPLEVIEERVATLSGVAAGQPAPAWARWSIAYHGWMRVLLRLRREAGRERDPERALEWLRASHRPGPDEPDVETLEPLVGSVLRPPAGRLSRWVLGRVGAAEGADADRVEQAIFPPRAERRR